MDITAEARASLRPGQTPVAGLVELVTERPIILPRQDGFGRARLEQSLGERPWILPSLLTALLVLFLLRRR
ncbi:MAG: hypothetical protein ABSA40_08350 [Candidatus Dormibacteria bacterium]|jgi:hypothetical protein